MAENPTSPPPGKMEILRRMIVPVWRTLAPAMSPTDYGNAMAGYHRNYLVVGKRTFHGSRLITQEEATSLPDNSADYESKSYRYSGLEAVKEMVGRQAPVMFIGWHHGAINHLDYSVARVLPEVAIFSRYTFQYGRVFAYPMLGGGALSLLRLDRFLREGRPALMHIDGPPEGATVELPLLGIPARFSTGPIRIVRRIEGVRIVPVTTYWRGDTIEVAFHPPVPAPERLAQMSERDIIAALLAFLEDDLRRNAPEQVVLEYIPYREAVAQAAAGPRTVTEDPAKT